MDMISLPSELWGEVFKQISADWLPHVTLTCQAFRTLGIPRLFQEFRFHPYFVDLGMLSMSRSRTVPQMRYTPDDETIEDAMKRLEFFASSSISPHVHKCEIIPWDSGNVDQGYDFGSSDPDNLLNAFFERLPRFSNLQHLDCHSVNFNLFALSQLSLVPDIHQLKLSSCNVYTTSVLPTVHARTFHFGYAGRPDVLSQCGAGKWFHLLDLDRLEDLKVWPNRASTAIFGDGTTLPSLTATRRLSLALPLSLIPTLPIILRRLPSLQRLHISQFGSQDSHQCQVLANQIPHSTPPPLLHYEGPYELLHLVIAPGMLSLSLDSFGPDVCDPDILSRQLVSYKHSLKNIKFFGAKLLRLDPSFFSDVCSLFGDLKAVYIEAGYGNDAFTPIGFLDDLPIDKLPVGIEHIIMDWSAQSYEEAESKSVSFKDTLVNQRSSIKSVWLSDWTHLAFFWKREESGHETVKKYPFYSGTARYTAILGRGTSRYAAILARGKFYPETFPLEL